MEYIEQFSELIDFVVNLKTFFILIIIISCFFFFRKNINDFTREQINHLIKNKKYIPNIFVELNENKEVLRYFIYGKKWKKRLIENFNLIYANGYGDILKKACNSPKGCYKLCTQISLEKIEKIIAFQLNFHNCFIERKINFKSDYKESQFIFEMLHYSYISILRKLYKYSKAANSKYFILTGSAGNGKTNLLCSISELLININEYVIFLNAKDIDGDILDFIFHKLTFLNIFNKFKKIYLLLINFLLIIQQKYLFIIIDAVNENDNKVFCNYLTEFINNISKYSRVKIIISCRNEYYNERFRKFLVTNVNISAFEFDLKEGSYSNIAITHIINVYKYFFKYSGKITHGVRNILSKQLLLMRIFFEVFKNSNEDVASIRKHEIFEKYIKLVQQNCGKNIENILDSVSDFMLENENYNDIELSDLQRIGISLDEINKIIDSSIFLSKKLTQNEGTIAREEKEVLYFVFDEMRDYYLARRIILKNITGNNVNVEAILEKLKQLRISNATCEEGVIHYCYIFFRTAKIIKKLGLTKDICNSILNFYFIPDSNRKISQYDLSARNEFKNLGLKIIFTSGIELSDFEILYIQDCLIKYPYEDSGIFFYTMLDGTLYGGIYNFDIFWRILFGLKNINAILEVLEAAIRHNSISNYFAFVEFIQYYNEVETTEQKIQIQKTIELILLFFKFSDNNTQDKLIDFFYNLPNHNELQSDIVFELNNSCDIKDYNYE